MRMNKIFKRSYVFPDLTFSPGALASRVLLRSALGSWYGYGRARRVKKFPPLARQETGYARNPRVLPHPVASLLSSAFVFGRLPSSYGVPQCFRIYSLTAKCKI